VQLVRSDVDALNGEGSSVEEEVRSDEEDWGEEGVSEDYKKLVQAMMS